MSLETQSFEFGEFLLDTREKVLLRNQKPLAITPKAFLLLQTLVENHGHIIAKEQLMESVWANSFVEESNLTFTINAVRKALADNRRHPRYIETVPKRGYRFIAPVVQSATGSSSNGSSASALAPPLMKDKSVAFRSSKYLIPVLSVFVLGVLATWIWYATSSNLEPDAPILSAPFSSEKLSTDGKAGYAVISSDGKNVVYLKRSGDRDGVWLRNLESGNNVEIIPPTKDVYGGIALSPDDSILYFSRRPYNADGQVDIYRVPIFGGIPAKIVTETQGWISVSPDGTKLSFVRCYYRDDEYCSLWMTDSADGKNERKLISRPRPIRIGANQFSPDGGSVAFAFGQSENAANEFSLAQIDIESRTEKALTTEAFFNIKHLAWLPNKAGLLFTASKIPNRHFRIWKLTAADGVVQPLTKDSETYSGMSLNYEASVLVSTQVKQNFQLFISDIQNPILSRSLTEASTVTFAPDGKIIFSSPISGNDEIWSINSDSSGQKQLTNNVADESAPVVSSDARSIFFASNRTGEVHVWKMNADGSGQVQITQKEGGFPLSVSPDGQWLYYISGMRRTLMRVAVQSLEEQVVLKQERYRFAISPDGLKVAFSDIQDGQRRLTIASLPSGEVIKTFPFADREARMAEATWSNSGQEIIYILADSEFENNVLWRQPLGGGEPRKMAEIGDDEVWDLALSPDNKSLAVVQGRWEHDSVLIRGLK